MSTEIKSGFTDRAVQIAATSGRWVQVISTAPQGADVMIDRADLLEAVSDELDVIVVERSELPEVEPSEATIYPLRTSPSSVRDDGLMAVQVSFPGCPNASPDWHRNRARAHLALAEHLDANPPVDEAQVAAVAAIFPEIDEARSVEWFARRLVEKGVRVEVTP